MARYRYLLTSLCGLGVVICLLAASVPSAFGDNKALRGALGALLRRLPEASALSVVDASTGEVIVERNPNRPLKPASVLKILTAVVALEELGPAYRFTTEVYEYPIGDGYGLALVGGGDPGLTIERLFALAREVRLAGRGRYQELLLDDSAFASSVKRQGQRAYQSGSGALSCNYNSVTISVCPTSAGRAAQIVLDPWESGWTVEGKITTGSKGSFTVDEVRPGLYRARGMIAPGACSKVYRSVADPVKYCGLIFSRLLRTVGIEGTPRTRLGSVPKGARLIATLKSEPLSHIIEDLNHYSNNFIGEQILYALGGPRPLDRDRGADALANYLLRAGIPREEVVVRDGSGLSHQNRLSARALTRLLLLNRDAVEIHPEFEVSLSVAGRSGTLRERDFGVPSGRIRAKTGTLDGVTTLAGYLTASSERKMAFAILLNGINDRGFGRSLEDDIIQAIYKYG